MDKRPNILFCGTLNTYKNGSWDKTNGFFFKALSDEAVCIHLDYSIQNVLVRKAYQLIAKLWYGETLVRDPLYDFLIEKIFKYHYNKLQVPPDLVIHSSGICIPKGYEKRSIQVLYTDATIMGAVRYNGLKPEGKALKLFTSETLKYIERCKYVFTFNEWTKQSLIEDFSVEKQKIINVGFGANLNPFYGEKDYTNNQILIVLRRGLEKNKGLHLLLQAFKIARKQNPDIKLAVVGTTLEPIDGVTYYEGYPRDKTIELFQQASLFAMPALFEPNGMVYIEALACKTPILGLNCLAFPEFSGYGKFGFTVEDNPESIAQTLLSAINNPQRLREMGETGQKYVVNHFNWDIVIKKIIDKSLI